MLLWPWMKVKVTETEMKLQSYIIQSLKEVISMLKVFFMQSP